MNKDCDNWYERLQGLKEALTVYKNEYTECKDAKDFLPIGPRKDELKTLLTTLRDEVMPRVNESQREQLKILERRFYVNSERHREIHTNEGISINPKYIWKKIELRLRKNPKLIDPLIRMEDTDGEPDAIWYDRENDQYIFVDCSAESPEGRRMICYNQEGQDEAERLGDKPIGNAVDMAAEMGIELLTEEEYRKLQELGVFDLITFSWVKSLNASSQNGAVFFHGFF